MKFKNANFVGGQKRNYFKNDTMFTVFEYPCGKVTACVTYGITDHNSCNGWTDFHTAQGEPYGTRKEVAEWLRSMR